MQKWQYAASLVIVLSASQAFAQQPGVKPSQPEEQPVVVDPMKGCYAADKFYSQGMVLKASTGIMVCKHSEDGYGNRTSGTPFEWVQQTSN